MFEFNLILKKVRLLILMFLAMSPALTVSYSLDGSLSDIPINTVGDAT